MKNIEKEFQEFCQCNNSACPEQSSEQSSAHSSEQSLQLWKKIENSLPASLTPFLAGKIAALYLLASAVVLLLCPQFGVRIPFTSINLMSWVMKVAPALCDTYCGALFMGVSFIALRAGLQKSEWNLVRQNKIFVFSLMAVVALGGFALMSARLPLQNVILWLMGGLLAMFFVSFIASFGSRRSRASLIGKPS